MEAAEFDEEELEGDDPSAQGDAEAAEADNGVDGIDGKELFRELLRYFPRARITDYYENGRWLTEELEVDTELIIRHRQEAGAPEPVPLDEIPEPVLPKPAPPSAPPPGMRRTPIEQTKQRPAPLSFSRPRIASHLPSKAQAIGQRPAAIGQRPAAIGQRPAPLSVDRPPGEWGLPPRNLPPALPARGLHLPPALPARGLPFASEAIGSMGNNQSRRIKRAAAWAAKQEEPPAKRQRTFSVFAPGQSKAPFEAPARPTAPRSTASLDTPSRPTTPRPTGPPGGKPSGAPRAESVKAKAMPSNGVQARRPPVVTRHIGIDSSRSAPGDLIKNLLF